ncbi:MAG: hypothetical protein EPN82_01585 [Bacteroidetes bacterium]|nr:MAG: hypothetical protein EPN82_01585 [Bacteroidota bacterium]
MSDYKVIEVRDKAGWKDFLSLPERIYSGNPCWVPEIKSEVRRQLDSKRNPYFHSNKLKLFLCYKNGDCISRASFVVNTRDREAYFGYFESINDFTAVKYLFDEMFKICSQEKISQLEGPFNPQYYGSAGLLLNNFKEMPAFYEIYNPEFYNELMAQLGFEIIKIGKTWKNTNCTEVVKKYLDDSITPLKIGDYSCKKVSWLSIFKDIRAISEIYEEAFSENYHYSQISFSEYLYLIRRLFLAISPSLVYIIYFKNEPAGFIISMYDINPLIKKYNGANGIFKKINILFTRKKMARLLVFAYGMKKKYRNSRGFLLGTKIFCKLLSNFKESVGVWITEGNTASESIANHLEYEPYKEFGIYAKKVIQISN